MRLSTTEGTLLLSALAVVAGLLAGAINLAFRALVEGSQAALLPGGDAEHFEGLSWPMRAAPAITGGLAVAALLALAGREHQRTGVVHVIEQTVYHQAVLPLRNAVLQFFGAAAALMGGLSVGREGPGVHLGAAAASQLARRLGLPHHSTRTLIACGTAAAIGAAFNTPLAGVAFAMEVVIMEYSIAGFLPVMLAAVCATTLTRAVYGSDPAFAVPSLSLQGLDSLPHVVIMGVGIGILGAAFIRGVVQITARTGHWPVWVRGAGAGLVVAAIALPVPQVMGVGYDTVNSALVGELALPLLLAAVAGKLVATACCIGLGVPAGLIGPVLFMGATAGGAFAHGFTLLQPAFPESAAFFALLGMGAMMASSIRAPLAALIAMLELSANPEVLLPGMLAITAAVLTTGELCRTDSVFLELLRREGKDPHRNPLLPVFNRVSVGRIMDRRMVVLPRKVERQRLTSVLDKDKPRWVLVEGEDDQRPVLMPVTDLIEFVRGNRLEDTVDLSEVPAKRLQPVAIELRATLREALLALRREQADALYVVQTTAPGFRRYYGVVTRGDLENQYFA